MTSYRKKTLRVCLALGLCAVVDGRAMQLRAQPAEVHPERARQIVVMVDTRFGEGGDATSSFGAGLIVGSRLGRIYVATANHLVRRGGSTARDVRVRFRGLPGEEFTARVLAFHDPQLDYAVIMVNDRAADPVMDELPVRILRSAPVTSGLPVFHVGQPAGSDWGVSVAPAAIARQDGSTLVFQSPTLRVGDSGGGLFDRDGALLGLVTREASRGAHAAAISHVLANLREEGIPTDLALAGSSPGRSEGGARTAVASTGTIGPVTMEATACTRAGTSLHCELFVTARVSGRFGLSHSTEGLDESGNVYNASEVRVGNQSHRHFINITLAAAVRTRAVLVFNDVEATATLPLLRVRAWFADSGWRYVSLQNVPVVGR